MEIVNRLNIYAAQNRNWLPPYYGDVSYDEMPDEGKAVIDSFQGEKAYREVVANKGFYLADISSNALVMLAGA